MKIVGHFKYENSSTVNPFHANTPISIPSENVRKKGFNPFMFQIYIYSYTPQLHFPLNVFVGTQTTFFKNASEQLLSRI